MRHSSWPDGTRHQFTLETQCEAKSFLFGLYGPFKLCSRLACFSMRFLILRFDFFLSFERVTLTVKELEYLYIFSEHFDKV